MAKDVLRAIARQQREQREQRAADERDPPVELEVVVDGYRRKRPLNPAERLQIEQERQALRKRLYAAG